jgi:predicted O-methyltransferase YrrM
MSEYIIYDTAPNASYNTPTSSGYKTSDPWDHLPPDEWVQKQVEYCITNSNIAGESLIPVLKELNGPLVSCEVGVCLGVTSRAFLENLPIIKHYAVDPYPAYLDWNGDVVGANFSEERQKLMKETAYKHLSDFKENIDFVYRPSTEFAKELNDEHLDFIFIDGDHSYEGCLEDLKSWWPKVKKGGVFAGHDLYFEGVNRALREFFGDQYNNLLKGTRDVWYVYK